jgi:dipeptidyl aminopeptidase/acylaminoacyl peptidase
MRLFWLCSLFSVLLAQKLPFDAAAMMRLQRLSDPALSPDGKQLLFSVQKIDIEKNARPRQTYLVRLDGSTPKAITTEGNNFRARWAPDGKSIAMISTRGGSAQIWLTDDNGNDAKQITNVSTEADGLTFSPDGKMILFTSDVFPDCGADDACNKKHLDEEAASKVKARVYTSLLYRHWTEFQGKRRRHLMLLDLPSSKIFDLTPGNRDVPPFSLGGPDDYAFTPDSKEVVFAANPDENLAMSTNSELYAVNVNGENTKRITENPGADLSPQFSPDGKFLVWRAQVTGGYESDRWRLMQLDRSTGKIVAITDSTDRNVQSFTFSPDSTQIFFTVEDRGRQLVFRMPIKGGGSQIVISGKESIDDLQFTPDGKTVIYSSMSGQAPTEFYKVSVGGKPEPLTKLNAELLNSHALMALEDFYVTSADKSRVHAFMVKPPDFDPSKKYPTLFLIHGGPEGHWGESWSYRWNPQVFANAGFLVVMPNPRGSTGYGQRFTEEIQADWGGKVFDDIMAVVDHVGKQSFADPDRFAAAGGSYGGYMVNWMLGHTDKFRAFVSHAGVFDLRSMAGETEELWFVNWEFKGMPWENPEVYAKWSPSYFVKDFKTPTLVIHGELDYRVPVGQGMQLFTGLQMQKVPSKMVLFPDEGHWILKPQNSLLWYKSVLDWVGEFTAKRQVAPVTGQ